MKVPVRAPVLLFENGTLMETGVGNPPVRSRKRVGRKRHSCVRDVAALKAAVVRAKEALENALSVKLPALSIQGRGSYTEAVQQVKEWMATASSSSRLRREGLGLAQRKRVELSVKLVKKVFPIGCKCVRTAGWENFKKSQSVESRPPPDPEFLDFARREVKKLFRNGWLTRSRWQRAVLDCPLTDAACAEYPRAKGGKSAAFSSYDEYLSVLEKPILDLPAAGFAEVPTGGKVRRLTKQPAGFSALGPLHKAIYDRLRTTKWLLVGTPSESKFKRAGFTSGGNLLSGDYAGATDSLDLRVTDVILSAVLEGADLPEGLAELAKASLRFRVQRGEDSFVVAKGQMMGFYLSFPLLCLYNRLVSLWALGNVPMLINGDDIVAQTQSAERWFDLLPQLGLEPERTKTSLCRSYCEVNSTGFIRSGASFRPVGVLRLKGLSPPAEVDPASLGTRHKAFLEGVPDAKRASAEWFKSWGSLVFRLLSLGVPLRSLGFSVNEWDYLASAGVLGSAKRHARRFHCPNPTPLSPVRSGVSDVVYLRRHNSESRAACVIESFCSIRAAAATRNHALKIPNTLLFKSLWSDLFANKPHTKVPQFKPSLKRSVAGARFSTIKMFFGEPLPSSRFLHRQLSPIPDLITAPAWFPYITTPSTMRALTAPAFVAALG
ncbi:RNA-dependent RNA polymerase [Magnaporthe oryzae botourmiavirus 6]|uniref:RNA-dependent RNA polymerase n=1 Tax=Magnaporthe oryzae botourmiavirus 6 TaxID=2755483 RepID=A0A7D5Y1B2_9VIRU|nr:RNA-dependent RNA polymerase [Magnaporthe oryzae botourmiavirus 6]QLJ94430.1 RNA-dependent RNA polymerase [Magnaporthe oryzae botourmiavirus 6]